MTNTLPVIAEVEGLGKIVEATGDFYTGLNQLKASGAVPISPRDEAYARLRTRGKEDIGRSYGTRTSAGFEHVRGESPILRLDSRLLVPELAKLAVSANANGVYFCTDSTREYEESFAQAQEDANKPPAERNVIILPSRKYFVISDRENREIYETIFKDQAESYFELNGPINVYPVPTNSKIVDNKSGTTLTQMWFRCLVDASGLGGDGWYLHCDGGLRGVLKSGEADALQHEFGHSYFIPKNAEETFGSTIMGEAGVGGQR